MLADAATDEANTADSVKFDTRSTKSALSRGSKQAAIVCLTESRGTASEVGVAIFDTNTYHTVLAQYSDTAGYSRTLQLLNIYPPSTILISASGLCESSPSKLSIAIIEVFVDIEIIKLPRKDFDDSLGQELIHSLCIAQEIPSLSVGLVKKYYCLSALAALYKYLESTFECNFQPNSLLFKQQSCEGTMFIDFNSAKNLELVCNLGQHAKAKRNLYKCLDRSKTKMGSRLIRTNILQPSSHLPTIQARLDCVQELLGHEKTFYHIQKELSVLPDVDQLISQLIKIPKFATPNLGEGHISQIFNLKKLLNTCLILADELAPFENRLFVSIRQNLCADPLIQLGNEIDSLLNKDIERNTTLAQHRKCYAIKAGCNGLLDVARRTLHETTQDVYEYASVLSQNLGINLQLGYSIKKGFYFTISNDDKKRLSLLSTDCFILQPNQQRVKTLTTMDLLKYNERISESLTEIFVLSEKILDGLLNKIQDEIAHLYYVSEAIALLDFIVSIADYASTSDAIRPEFEPILAIKTGRHPVLDATGHPGLIPNDVFAKAGHNFHIITGPNMSGKSTYLRQIALLQIMAQIGYFVPCELATFRLCTRLLTRLGSDDDMESNSSTFFVEMRDTAYALNYLDDQSLIIIDELGRGTSITEGQAITAAIAENLLASNAMVFFATHFCQLVQYLNTFPNAVLLHLSSEKDPFHIIPGALSQDRYGLELAHRLNLPKELLAFAEQIREKLDRTISPFEKTRLLIKQLSRRKLIVETAEKLNQIKLHAQSSGASPDQQLHQLQTTYLEQLEKLE